MDNDIYGVALVPLITGIIEVFKRIGLPTTYAPLLSLILGVIAGILVIELSPKGIMQGLTVGLAASGLYSSSLKPLVNKGGN